MNFYTYIWLREDGTPYYVGKGKGKRAFIRGSHHLRPPEDCTRILIFPMMSEGEAVDSEIALIELFGRKDLGTGCLRNFTNGGEGVSGLHHAILTRVRMSKAAQGRRMSLNCRLKISQALAGNKNRLGRKHSAAAREKIRVSLIGNKRSSGWPKGKPRGKKNAEI
jgi:NUMOD3 motif